MKLIDKLLLGLLVILIPLGIFFAQWFLRTPEEPQVAETEVDVNALEQLIRQAVAQSQPTQKEPKQSFTISAVTYASESGTIRLSGKAPTGDSNILVSATVIPNDRKTIISDELNPDGTTDEDEELNLEQGLSVQFYSVLPDEQGVFTYEYVVAEELRNSKVELRLDQNQASSTIRFDLVEKRQIS